MFFQNKSNNKNKYKICVYCICKNESKFVNRFMDSLEEIKEHIYVLDTGSTDNTVELFKKRGVKISEKHYEKFNFDVARNDSLALVPDYYDICICLDIDEVIKKGFSEVINRIWQENTTQIEYPFYCTVDKKGKPTMQFINNKIHSRKDFTWIYPIHEVLSYCGANPNIIQTNEIIVTHKPDLDKSREFYLNLLEERVESYPEDSRNILLLAREYNSRQKYIESIKMAHKYLNLKINCPHERVQAMCLLSNSYRNIKMYEEAQMWIDKAIEEPEITREKYLQKIILNFEFENYEQVIKSAQDALKIKEYNTRITDSPACWDGTIYDYLSIAYYYMQDYDNAIKYIELDIKQNPDIERLKENKKIFK